MWRTFLTLVLIGTTLTGPAFCCCSLAAFTKLGGSDTASTESGCCLGDFENGPCQSHQNGSDHQCPCKKHERLVATTLGDDQVVSLTDAHNRYELSPIVGLNVAMVTSSQHVALLAPCHRSCAFPHLDGGGILRAKQVSRC